MPTWLLYVCNKLWPMLRQFEFFITFNIFPRVVQLVICFLLCVSRSTAHMSALYCRRYVSSNYWSKMVSTSLHIFLFSKQSSANILCKLRGNSFLLFYMVLSNFFSLNNINQTKPFTQVKNEYIPLSVCVLLCPITFSLHLFKCKNVYFRSE